MKSYLVMVRVGLFIGLLFLCGCSSKSYELENHGIDSENIGATHNTEIKQEIVEPNLEIKEETVNPKPVVHIYSIQIGAFFEEKNAKEFIDNLKKTLPYDISYQFIDDFYKVRAGKFNNKEQVIAELNKLKNLGYNDAFIVEFPK